MRWPRAGAQHLAEGLRARNGVAEQHEARRRAVEIELREERVEHLLGRQRPVGARKIGAVAPVLVGAEEEHLDAELPRLLGDGEHVGLGNRARIDALLALDRGERADAVAQAGRALEIERRGRLAHRLAKAVLDRAAAAGEEIARFAHQFRVVVKRDFAGARRRAALDLVEQAGPGAVGVKTVRAGAQEKRPLERVQGSEHRAGAGERPEIIAGERARAAMLDQPRRGMAGADENIGEALVVAQRHIVAGLELLDEIGLEQQRFGVRFGGDEHHRAGLRHHARDAGGLALGRHVGGDALLDRARLADIEHLALWPDHAIDAGPERGVAPECADRLGAARHPRRLRRRLVEGRCRGARNWAQARARARLLPAPRPRALRREETYSTRRSCRSYLGASGCRWE